MDVGTSGGVWGLERGYCMMIGGEKDVVQHLDPIFSMLAPGDDAAVKAGVLKPETHPWITAIGVLAPGLPTNN